MQKTTEPDPENAPAIAELGSLAERKKAVAKIFESLNGEFPFTSEDRERLRELPWEAHRSELILHFFNLIENSYLENKAENLYDVARASGGVEPWLNSLITIEEEMQKDQVQESLPKQLGAYRFIQTLLSHEVIRRELLKDPKIAPTLLALRESLWSQYDSLLEPRKTREVELFKSFVNRQPTVSQLKILQSLTGDGAEFQDLLDRFFERVRTFADLGLPGSTILTVRSITWQLSLFRFNKIQSAGEINPVFAKNDKPKK